MRIPCICIDAKNKPKEVDSKFWITEGEIYHVNLLMRNKIQDTPTIKMYSVGLEEVQMDETCLPYQYYRIDRFAFRPEDISKLIELGKLCSEVDWDSPIDIDELIGKPKELELLN